MDDMTHVAILVPLDVRVVRSSRLLAEIISTPGAKISTLLPKLENEAMVSLMVVAPTVMASTTRAGDLLFAS